MIYDLEGISIILNILVYWNIIITAWLIYSYRRMKALKFDIKLLENQQRVIQHRLDALEHGGVTK